MNQTVEKIRWNIYDLEVLPQNQFNKYEIIDGELFVTKTPHRRHQQICGKIFRQLDIWSESNNLGETIIAPGIIFSESDNVSPDVVWVSKERLSQIEDEAGHLTDAPELIIEVLSPGKNNERRDKEAKLKLYSVEGVKEYWIVNRFTKQVEVYRRENARLILVATLLDGDEITTPLLPNFCCSISRFFPSYKISIINFAQLLKTDTSKVNILKSKNPDVIVMTLQEVTTTQAAFLLNLDILPRLPSRENAGFFSLGNPDRCLDRGDVLPLY